MTTFQVRDPATDGEDEYKTIHNKSTREKAAAYFRTARQLQHDHPVEVMNGDGQSVILPNPAKVLLPTAEPARKPGKRIGYHTKNGDTERIIAALSDGLFTGLTDNEILASLFGADVLPLFKRMLAARSTLYYLKRAGRIGYDRGRYYKLAEPAR